MTNILFSLIAFRISRDINPSPIQNFRNLNLEVYLLGAVGSLDGKCFICVNSFFWPLKTECNYNLVRSLF